MSDAVAACSTTEPTVILCPDIRAMTDAGSAEKACNNCDGPAVIGASSGQDRPAFSTD